MEGIKLSINVRVIPKKEMPKVKMHVKTEKQCVMKYTVAAREKNENFQDGKQETRHTSMLSYASSKKKIPSYQKGISPISMPPKQKTELPEIYNPIKTNKKVTSMNILDGIRQTTAKQKRKLQSEHFQDETRNYATEFRKPVQRIKLAELDGPKELTKDKKNQLYKSIRNEFHEVINSTNLISVKNSELLFKAFIEKGNNGVLVKEIVKKRWWWHIVDDPSKANLIWTQWYSKNTVAGLANAPIQDQTIAVEQYRGKKEQNIDSKSEAIRRLVDENTFSKLKTRISQTAQQNYFKKNHTRNTSHSLRNIQFEEEIKIFQIEELQKIHNHVQGCLNLHSKKLLFRNFQTFMKSKNMDPFQFLPLTFYIDSVESASYEELLAKYDEIGASQDKQEKNVWILKPGENSNRGNGIKVIGTREDLVKEIQKRLKGNSHRTLIIQKYLEKCFLVKNRKFDIRCYLLITTVNGILKGYWYQDGYIRTASGEYDLNNVSDPMIHLTNDAVQKKGEQFGKHQNNNKMSFDGFKSYLTKIGVSEDKFTEAYQQMKLISYYLVASVSSKIKRKQFTFELFGLDFMLDENLKPYLIEANSNPCLDSSGKILGKIIYELIENVLMTAIDPIFPPPAGIKKKNLEYVSKDYFQSNKFSLIFAGTELIKPRGQQ